MRRAPDGKFTDTFDLSPAEVYGKLEFLLGPTEKPWDTVLPTLYEKLRWFSVEDYLLLIGNPCLIGMATAVAAEYSADINFLQWSANEQQYIKVSINIDHGLPER